MPHPERPELDVTRPHPARVYDYWLGGKDNFAADREAGEAMLDPVTGHPGLRVMARQNRDFVLKAVRWAAAMAGVTQFADLGCGLPASPSVHDAARSAEPSARVVYVDRDPLVIAHVAALEAKGEGLAAVKADITEPGRVLEVIADLEAPGQAAAKLIDFSRPACLVLGGTLSGMDADTARSVVKGFTGALAAGSCVIISCASFADEKTAARIGEVFGGQPCAWRNHSPADVESFFVGLRIMRGRVADVRLWPMMPSGDGPDAQVLGGVGIIGGSDSGEGGGPDGS